MTDRPRDLDRDVVADAELAEKGPDFERRVGEPHPGARNRPAPADVELADEDLVLGELDKDGHGSGTFIAKGDPIPPELRSLPRRAAQGAPRRK
jgi:hypothetical protein